MDSKLKDLERKFKEDPNPETRTLYYQELIRSTDRKLLSRSTWQEVDFRGKPLSYLKDLANALIAAYGSDAKFSDSIENHTTLSISYESPESDDEYDTRKQEEANKENKKNELKKVAAATASFALAIDALKEYGLDEAEIEAILDDYLYPA